MRFREPSPEFITMLKEEYLVSFAGSQPQFDALDEVKADYIQGIIYVQMAASIQHERIFSRLFSKITSFVQNNALGEVFGSRTAIAMGADYEPEPDVVFIAASNPGTFGDAQFTGVPDLVMEIISKSTRKLDLETKRPLYQHYRIPEVYFVDFLNKQVIIDVLVNDAYQTLELQAGTYESRVLPGLTWQIQEMYAGG